MSEKIESRLHCWRRVLAQQQILELSDIADDITDDTISPISNGTDGVTVYSYSLMSQRTQKRGGQMSHVCVLLYSKAA